MEAVANMFVKIQLKDAVFRNYQQNMIKPHKHLIKKQDINL